MRSQSIFQSAAVFRTGAIRDSAVACGAGQLYAEKTVSCSSFISPRDYFVVRASALSWRLVPGDGCCLLPPEGYRLGYPFALIPALGAIALAGSEFSLPGPSKP